MSDVLSNVPPYRRLNDHQSTRHWQPESRQSTACLHAAADSAAPRTVEADIAPDDAPIGDTATARSLPTDAQVAADEDALIHDETTPAIEQPTNRNRTLDPAGEFDLDEPFVHKPDAPADPTAATDRAAVIDANTATPPVTEQTAAVEVE